MSKKYHKKEYEDIIKMPSNTLFISLSDRSIERRGYASTSWPAPSLLIENHLNLLILTLEGVHPIRVGVARFGVEMGVGDALKVIYALSDARRRRISATWTVGRVVNRPHVCYAGIRSG